jgi:hypothetical protein
MKILSLQNRFNNQCVKIRIIYSRILLAQKSSGREVDDRSEAIPIV